MNCEEFKNRIVDALYDELSGRDLEEFSDHMNSCSTCASLFQGMEVTVNTMDQRKNPEMDPSFSAEFWNKIEPSLSSEKPQRIRPVFTWHPSALPAWAYGIAAMFLIVVGIYVGRTYFTSVSASSPIQSSDLQTASINDTTTAQALAYLQRSKNFLLGVVNAPADEEPVLDTLRSRQLVDQANVIYATLKRPDQQQIRSLIDDLRIILLQLSNIEVRPGVPAVELVQRSIDRKSIFLKINIEELRAMADKPAGQNKNKEQNI
jgi:hypothetical protein